MSIRKRIFKNVSLLLIAEVIGHILSFILIIMISRYLGDSRLGIYSFAFAFTGIFAIVFELGVSTFIVRELSKNKRKTEAYFNNIATMRFISGTFGFLIPMIVILFIGRVGYDVWVVWLAGIVLFFNYLGLTFKSLFNVYEALEYEALARVTEKTVAVVLGATALALGYGLVAVVGCMVIAQIIYFLILFVSAHRKIIKIHLSFDFKLWKYILVKSIPFWFFILFLNIYFKVDTIMLTLMKDYAVTGLYNAAHKLLEGIQFIPFSFAFVMLAVMSRIAKQSKKLLQITYRKSFYYMLSLAIPIGIGTTLLADKIIIALYTGAFSQSVIALQILIWAIVFLFINHIVGVLLCSINKEYMFTLGVGISLFLNILLNFLLIPKFSFIGAAVATVVTEGVCFILIFSFATKNGYWLNPLKLCWKPVISAGIMGLFIMYSINLSLFVLIPVATAVYALALFLLRGIDHEEIEFFRSWITPK